MLFINFITLFPLSIAANKHIATPVNQGLDVIILNKDFVSGLLLGVGFVFILIGLSKRSES